MTVLIMLVFVGVIGIQSVYAIPTLTLSDGNPLYTVTIQDNSAFDLDPLSGVVNFSSGTLGMPIGVFDINITTGITLPAIGAVTLPEMDLNSVDVNSTGSGTLTINFSESGFGPLAAGGFETWVGGTTRGSVSFNTYVDSTLIGSLGPFAPGSFDSTAQTAISLSSPFTLTAIASITHTAPQQSSFNWDVHPIPEPSTLLLLGFGLIGLSVYGLRRMRKQ